MYFLAVLIPRFYSTNSRSLLFYYLSNIDLSRFSIVYLPEFICNELVPVFSHFKLQIKFYPVSNQLDPLLDDIASSSIVLLTSYFGFPVDSEYFHILRQKKCLILDDCSHCLYSKDVNNMPVGCRGDFGFISIWKSTTKGLGAFGFLSDPVSLLNSVPSLSSQSYYKKFTLYRLKRFILPSSISITLSRLRRALRYLIHGSLLPFKLDNHNFDFNPSLVYSISPSIFNLIQSYRTSEVERRRELFNQCLVFSKNLLLLPLLDTKYFSNPHAAPLGFPFIASRSSYQLFVQWANRRGLECLPWPDSPYQLKSTKYTKWQRSCYYVLF